MAIEKIIAHYNMPGTPSSLNSNQATNSSIPTHAHQFMHTNLCIPIHAHQFMRRVVGMGIHTNTWPPPIDGNAGRLGIQLGFC